MFSNMGSKSKNWSLSFHRILVTHWRLQYILQDIKDASIPVLYKNNGNRQTCTNWKGIALLSTAEKVPITATLCLNSADCKPCQCGFCSSRSSLRIRCHRSNNSREMHIAIRITLRLLHWPHKGVWLGDSKGPLLYSSALWLSRDAAVSSYYASSRDTDVCP